MSVNHSCTYITVSKEFLDSTDIVTGFKKMCCKEMSKCMAAFICFVNSGVSTLYCSLPPARAWRVAKPVLRSKTDRRGARKATGKGVLAQKKSRQEPFLWKLPGYFAGEN